MARFYKKLWDKLATRAEVEKAGKDIAALIKARDEEYWALMNKLKAEKGALATQEDIEEIQKLVFDKYEQAILDAGWGKQ